MATWTEMDVGSIRIPVIRRPRTHDEIVAGTLGYFDKIRCEIVIGEDLVPDLARATLMHELGHAIVYVFGLDAGDHDQEEDTVRRVSALVFDVLYRNGMLRLPDFPEAA